MSSRAPTYWGGKAGVSWVPACLLVPLREGRASEGPAEGRAGLGSGRGQVSPGYRGVARGRGGADREGRSQSGWCGGRTEPCGRSPGGRSRARPAPRRSPHLLQAPLVRVPLLRGQRLAAAQQPNQVQLQPGRGHRRAAAPRPFRPRHLEGGRKCRPGSSSGWACPLARRPAFVRGGGNVRFQEVTVPCDRRAASPAVLASI